MGRSPEAEVTPEVLRWARASGGLGIEEAAHRIGVSPEKLERSERGEERLTLRQAEAAAEVYGRPLAALFLPAPPAEEPQEAQLRRLPDAPALPWPPDLVKVARQVGERQDAATELRDLLEEDSPWQDTLARMDSQEGSLPEVVRRILNITIENQFSWRDQTGFVPLRLWVDAVERLGVLVMQTGVVPVELMRGFAALHQTTPAIVVNTRDDARSRAFTIIHELGHIWLSTQARTAVVDHEEWCDDFAGEVIMPRVHLAAVLRKTGNDDLLARMDEVAVTFGVTPMAATVRMTRLGLISKSDATEIMRRIRARGIRMTKGGGNYYRTQIGRLGPSFIRLVLSALDSQVLTYPAASGLLGVKVNNFLDLRNYVDQRQEAQ